MKIVMHDIKKGKNINGRYLIHFCRPMVEVEDPEAVLEMLARLGQSILRAKHDGSK